MYLNYILIKFYSFVLINIVINLCYLNSKNRN